MGADVYLPARRAALRLAAAALCGAALRLVAAEAPERPPSFAELEASHAVIGEIRVFTMDIFDLEDPQENNWFFRLTNKLHITTRPAVIRRSLLFKPGDPVSVRVIEETERLLRGNRYLYDVDIVPFKYHDGVVDIDVTTRDTWTLDLTGKYSRSGGTNATQWGIKDSNFLGTGTNFALSQVSDVDRRGSEFDIGYLQAFDGWTALAYFRGRYTDGSRNTASAIRPFYSLDTHWSAGARWDDWDRVDSIYN